jgi:hypothetical protein
MNTGGAKPTGSVEMKVIKGNGPRKRPGLLQRIKALAEKDVSRDN